MRLVPLLLAVSCALPPEGLRATPDGTGPLVRVDWDHEPLADIPFPTDLAMRPDPSSPTGMRPNLPLGDGIAMEVAIRRALNDSTGWGIYSPITVGFGEPLDLDELKARHPDDLHVDDHLADDAVFLIDVTPGSPTFLEAVPLDMGGGRFPGQLTRPDALLANDVRSPDGSSLLFETFSEDLDGDGRLDLGEDTDGDGLLDVANVWPEGGHPFYDLATFYERASDTLILRPVVPMREQTTYAVVLTERLVGEDGEPVRSPWAWVNHTRQTPALEPLRDGLGRFGLSVDDVAFAWTFTTGAITRDLHEVVDGLNGEGPYADLAEAYPPRVTEAAMLHGIEGIDPVTLPPKPLVSPIVALGLFDESSTELFTGGYTEFTDYLVGGAIESPYLLADHDGDGSDADEHWRIDRFSGTVHHAPRRIPFTCAIPKASGDVQPPWPIAIHGHGLGTTRIEFIAFAWALNRVGVAVCGIDAPGHGLSLGSDFDDIIGAFLAAVNTEETWWHLRDAQFRDLDNDGELDASADQFTADILHTRDMLRQPVLDWAQLQRALRACGEGTMEVVRPTEDGPERTGETRMTCDWNDDGVPDFGGPDTRFRFHGVSMGAIEGSLATAVLPDLDASVLTVPGGGLFDVGTRSAISSVVDGLVNRALSPLILTVPTADGGLELRQEVVVWNSSRQVTFARLPEAPLGGEVVVHNLDRDEVRRMRIPASGRVRIPMVAEALQPAEKALAAGIPEGGVEEGERYVVPGNEGLGDRLMIEVYDNLGALVHTIDTFEIEATHEGVTHEQGSPLIAASWGFGYHRSSTDLRRAVSVLSSVVEPADPIAYARQWWAEPDANPREVLIALTVGDDLVPEAAGVSLARAAGLVSYDRVDPRYGTSVDRWLIERGVVQGQEEWGPYRDAAGRPMLFDADDLDEGTDDYGAPSDEPLRATLEAGDGESALRILYVDPRGTHAYLIPDQSLGFDVHTFGAQQMAWFLGTAGAEVRDDPCQATANCPWLRPLDVPEEGDE